MQRHRIHNRHNQTRHDPRRPKTRDGPADDECHGIRGGATDGRADLEEQDGAEEHAFDGPECVDLAEEELEGAVGEQVGGAVPADVGYGLEVVCDLGDGGCDY